MRGLTRLPKDFSVAKTRLMYGTDGHLIMLKKGHDEYAERFKGIYEILGLDSSSFFGKNALRFLGLDGSPSGNRDRLLRFYEGRQKPKWWV